MARLQILADKSLAGSAVAPSSSAMLPQVAAMLLKGYKDKFSGAPLQATYTYLRQWASDALPPNPLVSHDTTTRHLRDSSFLIRSLRCAACLIWLGKTCT